MDQIAKKYVDRAEALLEQGKLVLGTRGKYTNVAGEYVDRTLFAEFRTSGLSFLLNVFGESSPFYTEFESKASSSAPLPVKRGIGILTAAKSEIEGGWLRSTKELISAGIFTDFLEMAEYLLSEEYKDASAVIIGSVLEERLRHLCESNEIPVSVRKKDKDVPKKADRLNSELAKSDVYNKLDQKNVTAWLGLRNNAAHGNYDEYTQDQVVLMLSSVMDFISRHPA